MNRMPIWVCAVIGHAALLFGQTETGRFPVLKGPYLGQTLPGGVPQPFLPEVFQNMHSVPVFSPDGRQVFWRSMDRKALLFMEEVDGIWTPPRPVSFWSRFHKQDVPFFSHDGKKLFFISTKPQQWYRLWSDEALWVVERKKDGWSRPKKAGERINRIETHWQFSVSANGNIYLNGKQGDRWFIFRSEWKDGDYSDPVKIVQPGTLAKGQSLYLFPFIAPDESYLLFSRSTGGDQGDLFVTYRREDGSWTEETSLGDNVNSPGLEICPMVSPDGKYLFYMRHDAIMWVSSEIIETLKSKE